MTHNTNDPDGVAADPAVDKVLRQALRQVDPPAGFAGRVIQRASAPAAHTAIRVSFVRWATAAALVLAVSGGLWYRAEERRREQGEEARRQVLLSLQITGSKLRAVQLKINHHGESQQ